MAERLTTQVASGARDPGGEVDQVIVVGPLPPISRERLAAGRTDVLEFAPCDTGKP